MMVLAGGRRPTLAPVTTPTPPTPQSVLHTQHASPLNTYLIEVVWRLSKKIRSCWARLYPRTSGDTNTVRPDQLPSDTNVFKLDDIDSYMRHVVVATQQRAERRAIDT